RTPKGRCNCSGHWMCPSSVLCSTVPGVQRSATSITLPTSLPASVCTAQARPGERVGRRLAWARSNPPRRAALGGRIMFRTVLIAVVPVLLAPPPAMTQSKIAGLSGEAILLRHCLAEYRHATLLGAPAAGVIQDCLVDLGDRVKEGQVLGRIQDLEQRAE